MAGQLIVVQRKVTLNYSNLPVSTTYEYVHAGAINVVHAREIILNVRMTQKNFGAGATGTVFVRGIYPDPDDPEVVGADFLTVALNAVSVGINTATQVNNIPAWVRVGTRWVQPSGATQLMATYSLELVVRE
ncbi:MAG: hypothetical protein K1X88_18750 [Nannocystaceae bacterium]|nr:hypothetical protein [Nannocystaceae bacterium]